MGLLPLVISGMGKALVPNTSERDWLNKHWTIISQGILLEGRRWKTMVEEGGGESH